MWRRYVQRSARSGTRLAPLTVGAGVTRQLVLLTQIQRSSLSLAERRRRKMLKKQKAGAKEASEVKAPRAVKEAPKKTFFNFDDGETVKKAPVKEAAAPVSGTRTSSNRGNANKKRATVPSEGGKEMDAFIKENKSVNTPRGKNRAAEKKEASRPRTAEEMRAIEEAVAAVLQANVEKAEVAVDSLKPQKRKPQPPVEEEDAAPIIEREQKAKETLNTLASTPHGKKQVASALARLEKSKVGRDLRKRYAETRKKLSTIRKREGIPVKNATTVIVNDTSNNVTAVMETSSDPPSTKPSKIKDTNVLSFPDYREKVLLIFQQLAEVNIALNEKYKTASYQIAVDRLKKDDLIFKELPPNLTPLPESYIKLVQDHHSGSDANLSPKDVALAEEIKENLRKRALLLSNANTPNAQKGGSYLGVGDKLRKKIVEILKTGDLKELHEYEAKPIIKAIRALSQVHGVGPRTALTFYKKHGIETVEQLKEAVAEQDKLDAEEGTPSGKRQQKQLSFRLTDAQRVGLKYYKEIQQRIPHGEGRLHEAFLKLRLKKHLNTVNGGKDGPYELILCGSYRRKCETSGDIDVLITRNAKKKAVDEVVQPIEALSHFINCLEKDKYLEAHLASGSTKYMGVCRLPAYEKDGKMRRFPARRIDIRYVDIYSYPAALCYFTGSKNFNVVMRAEALKRKFILNEYGLFKQGKVETSKLHQMIQKLAKAQYYIGGSPTAVETDIEDLEEEEESAEVSTPTKRKKKPLTEKEIAALEEIHKTVEQLRVKVKTEEDIFEAVGMDYVTPRDRDV
ncbi:mitochondrial DNA polymerase beta-PAK [Angomonas deanei]|uniref:Helix-hairpin-helix domain/Fingers domain of DNA polymerase lambda/DNA polymerase beta palm/DNA polymerase beta thumb, putative n=1 Tax=Angomonas deanei TaxID=59799 RepID=A0A7G2CC35_9TRYP|nr:mitochondrial DNA polymerase beta-PAK [Angomonas deanei]CAD2217079.1 Helix-hairpin-helix domain/Fingers domain of DNA polymerase lambda/DNA polymerase beta palm/DNA polymerase beta thumb, putative [Angomonas deanei]|eukprot:EPY37717.1 mitochondrial DNA polymerase beta-PAK [Angomonas deanei]